MKEARSLGAVRLCVLALLFAGMFPGIGPAMDADARVPRTAVTFRTDDVALQELFDAAESKSLGNQRQWGTYRVLVEGGYPWVWLETQPMGGTMWGKRDLTRARDNILIFVDHQTEDGKLPKCIHGVDENGQDCREMVCAGVKSQEPKETLQGYCFAAPAWEVYLLLGQDKEYLRRVYDAMARFDAWLWEHREWNNNGILDAERTRSSNLTDCTMVGY